MLLKSGTKEKVLSLRRENFISQTIKFETGGDKTGAYTNDPNDQGGETKWGISKRAYPHLDIKKLTYKEAVDIYKNNYYSSLIDSVVYEPLAFKVFDMSVLMGNLSAIQALQKAINDLGIVIAIDGKLGPLTLTAIAISNQVNLYEIYIKRLEKRIDWNILKRPTNIRFRKGWLNRINFKYGEKDAK